TGLDAGLFGATAMGDRTVVIGRDMLNRVIPYAKENGYIFYRGTSRLVPRRMMEKFSPKLLEKTDMWFNKQWIRREIRRGSRIIDIGEPPGYRPSPFYEMERQQVRDYWNHMKVPQP